METISLLGIDLAKSVFQLHGVDSSGKAVLKRKMRRKEMLEFVVNLKPCIIAMEACGGSSFFARKFESFGHEVRMIAPQYVKPFVRGNKNDAADARAITEAALVPDMKFVRPKSAFHQDLQSLHVVRERLKRSRVAIMNEMRGLLMEYGLVFLVGPTALKRGLITLLSGKEDLGDTTVETRKTMQQLYSELLETEAKIAEQDKEIEKISNNHPLTAKLTEVRGLGKLSVSALLIALSAPLQFKNGRNFAAWAGLVPGHRGTGGKNRVTGITKRGNKYLRCLLIHGARASLRTSIHRSSKGLKLDPLEKWVLRLQERQGWNRACVALAGKNAKIAWAIAASGENFDPARAAQ